MVNRLTNNSCREAIGQLMWESAEAAMPYGDRDHAAHILLQHLRELQSKPWVLKRCRSDFYIGWFYFVLNTMQSHSKQTESMVPTSLQFASQIGALGIVTIKTQIPYFAGQREESCCSLEDTNETKTNNNSAALRSKAPNTLPRDKTPK